MDTDADPRHHTEHAGTDNGLGEIAIERALAGAGVRLEHLTPVVVDMKALEKLPPSQVCLICTGSQEEPLAALLRMANRDHVIRITDGDTVLLASSLIPGNENAVYRVINELIRWGANVVHKGNAKVHVSGDASAGERLHSALDYRTPQEALNEWTNSQVAA